MRTNRSAVLASLLTLSCNSVIGLSDLEVTTETVVPEEEGECTTNVECTEKLSANSDGGVTVPAVCIGEPKHCVSLVNEDCTTVTGDYEDDEIILIGSLFSTTGAQAATNLARQQSAALAVEQINELGGVPSNGDERVRKLVLVSCDESVDLARATSHLVHDLEVPAIVGPNTSADTLKISSDFTIESKTLVMTPTGVASSIAALDDDNLTFQMVPTDVQRAVLMISQLNALEQEIRSTTGKDKVKLGIVYRDDALGIGTRTALNDLTFNSKPLADSVNFQNNVQISPYNPTKPDQAALVASYVEFAPDIIVLAGTAEAVSQVLVPLEAAWTAPHRPLYVGIDSVKVPELLTAATGNDDLRRRVRGTGITPSPESKPAFDAFKIDYGTRFPGSSTTISGMGPSYDAVFAIAFGIAANRTKLVTGPNIVDGFARLVGGDMQIAVGATKVLDAFRELDAGRNLSAIGTFTRLEWNEFGAVMGATLEMWCIGSSGGKTAYQSSGLTFGIRDGISYGTYAECSAD
jgi:ABC-type branched-subunit amino acid transport system substrate-binding protein